MATKQTKAPTRRADKATLAVAAILKEFGQHGFDISERSQAALESMCEEWIAHLLDGAESPAHRDLDESWLDWPGVRDFVSTERGRERSYVVDNIDGYQKLALTLLDDFSNAVQVEQDSDSALRTRLTSLRESSATKDGEELKAEVVSAVKELNTVLEEKKRRQDTQLVALAQQLETLQAELAEAKESAEKDALTGLYNRGSFDKWIAATLLARVEDGRPRTLIVGDIDHFKGLNDTYGHQFGDDVIRDVAATMNRVFGEELDFVARYGGEEFVVITTAAVEPARVKADSLLKEIRDLRFDHEGKEVSVTISLGIAELQPELTAENWIEFGDRALYASKKAGRDRLSIAGGM
ncbi:MAG: GGDEF domain-containing protein [Planctomycetota bacterium]